MIVTCYICGTQFEVDEEVFFEDYDPLDDFDVCDDCYEKILDWIISRN